MSVINESLRVAPPQQTFTWGLFAHKYGSTNVTSYCEVPCIQYKYFDYTFGFTWNQDNASYVFISGIDESGEETIIYKAIEPVLTKQTADISKYVKLKFGYTSPGTGGTNGTGTLYN